MTWDTTKNTDFKTWSGQPEPIEDPPLAVSANGTSACWISPYRYDLGDRFCRYAPITYISCPVPAAPAVNQMHTFICPQPPAPATKAEVIAKLAELLAQDILTAEQFVRVIEALKGKA